MSGVIYKCPRCKVSLVPRTCIWVHSKNTEIAYSAERIMHIINTSYIYWKCPVCDYDTISEIEEEVNSKYEGGSFSYIAKKKLLRKKGR